MVGLGNIAVELGICQFDSDQVGKPQFSYRVVATFSQYQCRT